MRQLILPFLIILFSSISFAEILSNQLDEEDIVEMATNRSYPGGMDEDDLEVQGELLDVQPHVTTATLQWRARNSISRNTATDKETSTSGQ